LHRGTDTEDDGEVRVDEGVRQDIRYDDLGWFRSRLSRTNLLGPLRTFTYEVPYPLALGAYFLLESPNTLL
jgi:hypothetical protein